MIALFNPFTDINMASVNAEASTYEELSQQSQFSQQSSSTNDSQSSEVKHGFFH